MNILSIILGLVSSVVMLVGLIPLLGWINWLMLPFAVIGMIIGVFGERKTGLILNIIVAAVGFLRLILGGGII